MGGGTVGARLESVREPSHRLTQHKRRGSRKVSGSLGIWGRHPPSHEGIKARGGDGGLGPFLCRQALNRHDLRTTRAPSRLNISRMANEVAVDHLRGGKSSARSRDQAMAKLAR